jgi:uncharacterized protein
MPTIFQLVDADDARALVKLLGRDPAAAASRDDDGNSPLMRAAYRGRRAAFDAILAAAPALDAWDRVIAGEADGLPPPDAWSHDGFTPLHLAAFAHNLEGARALLAAGADPNAISRASFAQVTPLGTAAFSHSIEVAKLLLAHGADPTLTSAPGAGTPLDSARANGNAELIALLEAAASATGRASEKP